MKSLQLVRSGLAVAAVALLALGVPFQAAARDLYVNRCVGNCTVFLGFDNAQTQTSSVVTQTSDIVAFAHGDASFDATVACVKRAVAPFAISVVTTKPTIAHHQLILAGVPGNAGQPSGVLGVSPYAPGLVKENTIAFAFANAIGNDVARLCWIGAQQVASLYGLDVEYSCPDLTSYLDTCPIAQKSFTDVDAPCGEFSPRACNDGPGVTTQNSYELLAVRAGLNQMFADSFESATTAQQAPD